tara:strand:+ start:5070 stop:5486 length:417 start_codon:yes stop_codon:yes gene_type:complete
MTESLILQNIDEKDYEFLFNLLKNRKPNVSISHKKMPTYEEHVKFIESKPYHQWYIIFLNGEKVGSAYLSKNDEIGISLVENIQGKNIGSEVLDLVIKKNPRTRYLANINPNNLYSKKFFEKNGFELIQHTFEKISNN